MVPLPAATSFQFLWLYLRVGLLCQGIFLAVHVLLSFKPLIFTHTSVALCTHLPSAMLDHQACSAAPASLCWESRHSLVWCRLSWQGLPSWVLGGGGSFLRTAAETLQGFRPGLASCPSRGGRAFPLPAPSHSGFSSVPWEWRDLPPFSLRITAPVL